jgi:hypothetical protein
MIPISVVDAAKRESQVINLVTLLAYGARQSWKKTQIASSLLA